VAAMVRQYYRDGNYTAFGPFMPSAALVKATIIHSGQEMEGLEMDERKKVEGFGRVQLDTVLPYNESLTMTILSGPSDVAVPQGENHTFCFQLQSNKLKSTLVWTDYPATPIAALHLVNNLDLLLISQSGSVYYANGLSYLDSLNNVEQVESGPSPGLYTIVVSAENIPKGPQPYALIVTGNASLVESVTDSCGVCGGTGICPTIVKEGGPPSPPPPPPPSSGVGLALGIGLGVLILLIVAVIAATGAESSTPNIGSRSVRPVQAIAVGKKFH